MIVLISSSWAGIDMGFGNLRNQEDGRSASVVAVGTYRRQKKNNFSASIFPIKSAPGIYIAYAVTND